MKTQICKLVLFIFIVDCNEISNVLNVINYILFVGRINREII